MNEKNPRKLLSFVWLVYFPFILSYLIKDQENDFNLSLNDLKIIESYQKAWYFVIFMTIILVVLFLVWFRYNIYLLDNITYILSILLVVYIFYNIINIFTDKNAFLFSKSDIKNIEINKIEEWKIEYLFLYTPFLNYYLYLNKKYNENDKYLLKESIFMYLLLSIFWILWFYFYWAISLFYVILLFIIVRIVSLFLWIDFIPDKLKQFIYSSFDISIFQIFKYIEAIFYYIFNNLLNFLKNKKIVPYIHYVKNIDTFLKTWYELKSILKKPKKFLFLILSYAIFIIYISYLFYASLTSYNIYIYIISLLILSYYIFWNIFYEKKILPLPFLSLIIFYIIRIFK